MYIVRLDDDWIMNQLCIEIDEKIIRQIAKKQGIEICLEEYSEYLGEMDMEKFIKACKKLHIRLLAYEIEDFLEKYGFQSDGSRWDPIHRTFWMRFCIPTNIFYMPGYEYY